MKFKDFAKGYLSGLGVIAALTLFICTYNVLSLTPSVILCGLFFIFAGLTAVFIFVSIFIGLVTIFEEEK